MISYRRFWKRLKESGISQYELIHRYHISSGQLDRLRKNMHVSTHTLEVFCRILSCSVEDIIEHIPDTPQKPAATRPVPLLRQGETEVGRRSAELRQKSGRISQKKRRP